MVQEQSPLFAVQLLICGYVISRCVHVLARLGVADVLEDEPKTAAELAPLVGAHAEALYRTMRLAAAHGVFVQEGDTFRHSVISRLLRQDHPQSLRPLTMMMGFDTIWDTFREFEFSVETGVPASTKTIPGGFWADLAAHPERSEIFNGAMAGKAAGQVHAIVGAYDFTPFASVADIGGGQGHLLRAVVRSSPGTQGVLFDQPHVVSSVKTEPGERIRLQGGDFFKDELPVCDAYLLMEIVHDWSDEEATAILKAVRRAAPKGAKLLLLETLVPDEPGPDWAKLLDVLMLGLLGGKQRTQREYEALLERSGFALERIVPTDAGISLLEAVPV